MRVVSLIASSTETVCALGFEETLVGRSHECDYPASVKALPAVSQPRFDIHGTSREIDDRVKQAVQKFDSVYQIDKGRLRALKPDVIITQDHCEVCAVSLKDVEAAVCEWGGAQPPTIVTLLPNCLEDIWDGMTRIGAALGESQKANAKIREYQNRIQAIARKIPDGPAPSVACLEWLDPLMVAGNWVPELAQLLRARDPFGVPGKHSPWMEWEALVKEDPDYIFVMPCGWDIPKARQEMAGLERRPEWARLKAVKTGNVYLTDGNQYFNRPGPRIVESLEILAEILYPKNFQFGHQSRGWQKYAVFGEIST